MRDCKESKTKETERERRERREREEREKRESNLLEEEELEEFGLETMFGMEMSLMSPKGRKAANSVSWLTWSSKPPTKTTEVMFKYMVFVLV
jgi:hypothetical protein